MKLSTAIFFCALCSLLCLGFASPAQKIHFQSYTSSQGLSQNSVYSIAETDDGFMWFGTQDGLNRFDGQNFIQVTGKKNNDTQNEATGFSKMITALCADSNLLWTGTTYEIILYNRITNRFLTPSAVFKGFTIPDNIWVLKILKGPDNNIWILTRNKGLFCYSKSLMKMLPIVWDTAPANIVSLSWQDDGQLWACSETTLYTSTTTGHFTAITGNAFLQSSFTGIGDIQAIKKNIWLVTKTGDIKILYLYRNEVVKTVSFKDEFSGNHFLTDARLMHKSDSNTLWIGSRSDGLIKVDLTTKTFENAAAYQNDYALQRPFILSFFTSRQKIIWVGSSGGGIAKYDAAKPQFGLWRSGVLKNKGLVNDNMILSIYSGNEKDFYMGTMVGGLIHFNEEENTWQYYLPEELNKNPASKNIYTIAAGSNNSLWLATWGGLYNFNLQSKKFSLFTNSQDEQTTELTTVSKLTLENKLLTGGYRGAFRLFDLQRMQFEMPKDVRHILDSVKLRIRYMKEMQHGDIYMATEAEGFVKYNYLSGLFTFFPHLTRSSSDCRHFCFSNGSVWIATTDGLIQADSSSLQVKKIWSVNDGIPNNYIYAVEADSRGMLWVSSNAGICSINTLTGICQKYKEENGLQGMEYNTAAVFKTSKNAIWFGGINGLNRIKVTPLKEPGLTPPAPLITNIKIMNVEYLPDTATPYLHSITLQHNKNFISFQFQAPVFSQTENVIYEYRLSGVDTGWINSGSRNFANYTQLKPGTYNLYVRCASADMIWSKTVSALHITVVPPWYGTWWFRIAALAIAVSITIFFIDQRIRNIKYKAAVKQKMAETEMAALKAQMNPHFMFNCINSIDAFIQSNDKYNATLYLNKFARLIRNVLEGSKENLVLFSKDIETLKLYIELEELRSDGKFRTIFDIDKELMTGDYHVPALIVQPFIENAIIHGLRNKEDNDGLLEIKISLSKNGIGYIIKDNGIGREKAATVNSRKEKSYGMQMSHDRVMLFNKEKQASVVISDIFNNGRPAGTEVSVQLKAI